MKIPLMSVGEFLKEEFLVPLNISIQKLADDTSISVEELTNCLNGQRTFDYDSALKVSKYFGYESNLVYKYQVDYLDRKSDSFYFSKLH